MSRLVLAFHTLLFLSFAAVAIASPIVGYLHPEIFSNPRILIGTIIVMIIVVGSWPLAGGCPFTIWENKLRKKEGELAYEGGCIDHYVKVWFGISLPEKLSTRVLVVLLALPVITSLVIWL